LQKLRPPPPGAQPMSERLDAQRSAARVPAGSLLVGMPGRVGEAVGGDPSAELSDATPHTFRGHSHDRACAEPHADSSGSEVFEETSLPGLRVFRRQRMAGRAPPCASPASSPAPGVARSRAACLEEELSRPADQALLQAGREPRRGGQIHRERLAGSLEKGPAAPELSGQDCELFPWISHQEGERPLAGASSGVVSGSPTRTISVAEARGI
jgi:hypothetical protein